MKVLEQPLGRDAFDAHAVLRRELGGRRALALDESLYEPGGLRRIIAAEAADEVVVKPMFCGGLLAARVLVKRASAAGLAVSITHALESLVGRLGALHLACATLPEDGPACGLDLGELWPHATLWDGPAITRPPSPGLGDRLAALTKARAL